MCSDVGDVNICLLLSNVALLSKTYSPACEASMMLGKQENNPNFHKNKISFLKLLLKNH